MRALPSVGDEVAGYRIEAELAQGGMGVLYLATQLGVDRPVALKVLRPDLVGDEAFRRRFERESRLAANMSHPNIITVFDAGAVDGLLFIAMQRVLGQDLRRILAQHAPLGIDETLATLGPIARALDTAHGRGLVHRDVKPANVLVASGEGSERVGHPYLTDFGVSTFDGSQEPLTLPGAFVGTFLYAAPEQFRADRVGSKTDQYALGAVLFECLTGTPPYEGSPVALMHSHLTEPVPSASGRRPELGKGVDAVLGRALAKEPSERFASCNDLVRALRSAADGGPPSPTPVPSAAVASAVPPPTVPVPAPAPPPIWRPDDTAVLPAVPPARPAAGRLYPSAPTPEPPVEEGRRRSIWVPLAVIGASLVVILGALALGASAGDIPAGTSVGTTPTAPVSSASPSGPFAELVDLLPAELGPTCEEATGAPSGFTPSVAARCPVPGQEGLSATYFRFDDVAEVERLYDGEADRMSGEGRTQSDPAGCAAALPTADRFHAAEATGGAGRVLCFSDAGASVVEITWPDQRVFALIRAEPPIPEGGDAGTVLRRLPELEVGG